MSIERRYSKTKANANHVTWTGREVVQVPFYKDGAIVNDLSTAVLRIVGNGMYCAGIRLDFKTPAGSSQVKLLISLRNGRDETIPNTSFWSLGPRMAEEKFFTAPVVMPTGSIWKIHFSAEGPADYLPQGVNVTYFLRYANGPVRSAHATPELLANGIGFWNIGDTLAVQ